MDVYKRGDVVVVAHGDQIIVIRGDGINITRLICSSDSEYLAGFVAGLDATPLDVNFLDEDTTNR